MNGLKRVHSVAGGALGRPRIKPSKTNCKGNYEKSLAPHLALAGVVRGLARRSERGRLPAVLAFPYLRDRAAASDRNAAVTSPRSESRTNRLRINPDTMSKAKSTARRSKELISTGEIRDIPEVRTGKARCADASTGRSKTPSACGSMLTCLPGSRHAARSANPRSARSCASTYAGILNPTGHLNSRYVLLHALSRQSPPGIPLTAASPYGGLPLTVPSPSGRGLA